MSGKSKSEAIRRVLEADPNIKCAHALAMLAKEGIEVTPELFRSVKRYWRRDTRKREESEQKYTASRDSRKAGVILSVLEDAASALDVERRLPLGSTLARLAELSVEIAARRRAEYTARQEVWEEPEPEFPPMLMVTNIITAEIEEARETLTLYSKNFPGIEGMTPPVDDVAKIYDKLTNEKEYYDSINGQLFDRIIREACFLYDFRTKRIFGTTYDALVEVQNKAKPHVELQRPEPVLANQPEPVSAPPPAPAPEPPLEHSISLDDLVKRVKRSMGPEWDEVLDHYGHELVAIHDINATLDGLMKDGVPPDQAVEQFITGLKSKLVVRDLPSNEVIIDEDEDEEIVLDTKPLETRRGYDDP